MNDGTVVRPGLRFTPNVELTNFSRNVPTTKAAGIYDVSNGASKSDWRAAVENLAYVVRKAEEDGLPVRAIATAWSFSPCMVTTGYAVNVLDLSRVLPHFQAADLVNANDLGRVVHVQAGTRVGAVNDYLMSQGKSLRTMGGRGGQTIGGAIATGSHGAQIDERPLADQVRGVHVIGRGGESVWIQGSSRPLVTPKWAQDRGMRLVESDDALNAVTVSVGCLGIVHSFAIEIVDGFNLDFHRKRVKLTPELRALMRTLDFGAGYPLPGGTGRPFHFEVVINPYAVDTDRGVSLTVCWKAPFAVPPPPPGGTRLVPGDGVGDVLAALAKLAPGAVPSTLGLLLDREYPEKHVNAPFAIVFPRNVPQGYRPMATELAIPVAKAEVALDAILDAIDAARAQDRYAYPGLVSFRYGRATNALIGMSSFEPTCTIEFPCLAGVPGTADFFRRVWSALDAKNVPFRRHWGQVNYLTKARTASDYGERLVRWKKQRDALLGPGNRTFANAYSDAAGLTK
ncbi:MAG TPA: FAD-binding protein [Sandaracinaceae bacterium]